MLREGGDILTFHFMSCHINVDLASFSIYFFAECRGALGMESGAITDGQLSASSEWDGNHGAYRGRLNIKRNGRLQGAWSARRNDANQWLQIDLFDENAKVTGVATQGRENHNQWVTKYKLQYSNDGVNFQDYKEQGQSAYKVNRVFMCNFKNHFFSFFLSFPCS